jgi:hypothetical protein
MKAPTTRPGINSLPLTLVSFAPFCSTTPPFIELRF